MSYSGIWILAEQKNGKINRVSFELLTRGLELSAQNGVKLSVMIFGNNIQQEELQKLINCGADKIVCVENSQLKDFQIEPFAANMLAVIDKYKPEIIIAGATSMGRTLMPYVATKAHTGLTADCTELRIEPESGNLLQTRPAIGGNILATIKTPNHRPQMATVRPRSTKPAEKISDRVGEIIRLQADEKTCASRIITDKFVPSQDTVTLAEADTIIAVGRGIKRGENLALIQELADSLGAAIGATRDVVDRGWLSYPHQIGLSGQTVSPKLYIAIGISGTIQHLAGMQTAENIIAINNDPDAQIFKVADFGIVGDLFEIVPLMIKQIKEQCR